jgi:carboxymethylenebutenolidase
METIDLSGSPVSGISQGLSGYLARPSGDGPWPGLVVIFEAFGADDVNKRHVERLASMGYLALMPDLYSQGGALRCLVSTFRALGQGAGRPFNDIEAARLWLAAAPDCTGAVGILGFCMGGGFALATANRGFDAASVNYGVLPTDLDGALDGACPIVGSYPGKDAMLKGKAAVLETALEKAGVPHDIKEYPDAGHSFLNDARNGPKVLRPLFKRIGIGPEPAAAADAWQRIDAFFTQHLTRS